MPLERVVEPDALADQAFAVLRRYSQDNNVKLRDLAQHLVETKELPQRLKNRREAAPGRPDPATGAPAKVETHAEHPTTPH